MAEQSKALLIAQLEQARDQMSRSAGHLRQDLDVPNHVRSAFQNHKSVWIGGAALLGWVLSKFPGRSKPVAPAAQRHNGTHQLEGHQARRFAISGVLLALLRMGFNALKPTLTAVASRKLKDLAVQRIRW